MAPVVSDAPVDDVAEARVAVMSIPSCPYCKRAKEALTAAGIDYVDVNVAIDQELRQVVRDITGKRTVPQIFVAGRSVGGSDDLLAQLADGSFAKLLEEGADAKAVPPQLVAAIQAARRRAAEAQAVTAAAPESEAAVQQRRLKELAARMALPPAQGGVAREERKIGSRLFRAFTPEQLRAWLGAAATAGPSAGSGSGAASDTHRGDPAATFRQLLEANLVVPAADERQQAEQAAAALMAAGATAAPGLGSDVVLTLAVEAPTAAPGEALNTQYWWHGPARPASEVAADLRHLILDLYDKHLSADGRTVSYGAIRADPRFAEFVAATAELQKVDLAPLSRAELIAFGINLYNALIIHALVALNLTRMNAAQRATFFSKVAKYNIGGVDFTADNLENGVLRGNRAGAANLFNVLGLHGLAGGHLSKGDPRLKKVVDPVDPRIHFALVCGAKSCPPIKLYSADNLEEGLAAAAEAFCAGGVRVDAARREVTLSKIFKWYAVDFGANKLDRLAYISTFLSEPAKGELEKMVREAKSGGPGVQVSYSEYDWSLNGTD